MNFKPTRWSLVLQSRGEGELASRALAELCRAYWFPLYAWSRRFGVSPEDSEDLVQGFFAEVLEKRLFDRADPTLGKLRTFLLTAFQRHVHDELRRQSRQKRGGGRVVAFNALEAEAWYELEQVEGESADHMFDRQWALTVLDQALAKVEHHMAARGRSNEFAVMRPLLTGESVTAIHENLGKSLGMSANAFKVALHRIRSRFREALREEIADTQPAGCSVDEEMAYLIKVLSKSQG